MTTRQIKHNLWNFFNKKACMKFDKDNDKFNYCITLPDLNLITFVEELIDECIIKNDSLINCISELEDLSPVAKKYILNHKNPTMQNDVDIIYFKNRLNEFLKEIKI